MTFEAPVFNFDEVQFIFSLVACALGCLTKKSLPDPRSQRFSKCYSFALTFRSLIHLQFISVYGMRFGVQLYFIASR